MLQLIVSSLMLVSGWFTPMSLWSFGVYMIYAASARRNPSNDRLISYRSVLGNLSISHPTVHNHVWIEASAVWCCDGTAMHRTSARVGSGRGGARRGEGCAVWLHWPMVRIALCVEVLVRMLFWTRSHLHDMIETTVMPRLQVGNNTMNTQNTT